MCGIFGIVMHNGKITPEKNLLEQTARLLEHRGPDSFGLYAEPGIGLVHTRLSLVDLSSRSDQPFWDTEGRYCIIYNGEIYNFKELRSELEKQGVRFRTTSDTEVLLASVMRYGIEATLPKLDGMFAFAVYDKAQKQIVLARDRFGMKPLFVYDEDDCFMFSSEVAALRPWLTMKPDVLSISSFLSGFSGPTKGYTFFEKIKILPPGSMAKCQIGKDTGYDRFFSISDLWCPDSSTELKALKTGQMVDKLDELLVNSVQRHLLADAPVGALCSGGVDSSLILAIAAKTHNNLAIFHANVVGPLSEYDAASRLAKYLRLDLKSVDVFDRDFIDTIPDIIEHWGHPFFACPHSVPYLMVSRLVRSEGVKAVLSGEGADEGFLGYSWMAPNISKNLIRTLLRPFSAVKKRIVAANHWEILLHRLVTGLQNRFELEIEEQEIRTRLHGYSKEDQYRIMENVRVFGYNLRPILQRNDSMGMAASVEARYPYLTPDVMKFAVNLPFAWKMKFQPTALNNNHYPYTDKWVLRKLAERYLPKDLSYRYKRPFPVDAFSRMQISNAYLEKSFISELFGLSGQEAKYLVENSDQGLKVKIMQADVWASLFLKGIHKDRVSERLAPNIAIRPIGEAYRQTVTSSVE